MINLIILKNHKWFLILLFFKYLYRIKFAKPFRRIDFKDQKKYKSCIKKCQLSFICYVILCCKYFKRSKMDTETEIESLSSLFYSIFVSLHQHKLKLFITKWISFNYFLLNIYIYFNFWNLFSKDISYILIYHEYIDSYEITQFLIWVSSLDWKH